MRQCGLERCEQQVMQLEETTGARQGQLHVRGHLQSIADRIDDVRQLHGRLCKQGPRGRVNPSSRFGYDSRYACELTALRDALAIDRRAQVEILPEGEGATHELIQCAPWG